jgi:glycosyltransferase involved in cell wall biosynthesis
MHVTVLIPVYNRERFIGDALDSVIAQDYHDWDILVVDDGSTDRTVEVVKSRMSDDRITLIQMKHGGCAAAIAMGFEYARGPVITYLGSDDRLMRDSLSTVMPAFEKNPRLGYVWTNYVESTGIKGMMGFLPDKKTLLEAMISGWWAGWCEQFFRKSFYLQSKGLDTSIKYAVDTQLALLFGKTGCDTLHIPKVTYSYRMHSHRISVEHHAEQMEAYRLLRRKFRSENMELTEQYIIELEKQIRECKEQIKELKNSYAEQIKQLESSYALRLARRIPFGSQIRKLLISKK